MKSLLTAAVTAALLAAPPALACSKREAQAKADAVSARMQALAKQDPKRLRAVVPKVEKASQKLRDALEKNPNDLNEICRYFDDVLAEMN
jgi:hypothetical protein